MRHKRLATDRANAGFRAQILLIAGALFAIDIAVEMTPENTALKFLPAPAANVCGASFHETRDCFSRLLAVPCTALF
jgi:hypothetical protein